MTIDGVYGSSEGANPTLQLWHWPLAVFAVLYLALVIGALVSISKSVHTSPTVKVLWYLVVLVAPFLGSLLWFIAGRSNTAVENRLTGEADPAGGPKR